MLKSGKGRWIFIISGVILLIAAVIQWWDLLDEGGGIFSPIVFTLMGVFWLLYGIKAKAKGDKE